MPVNILHPDKDYISHTDLSLPVQPRINPEDLPISWVVRNLALDILIRTPPTHSFVDTQLFHKFIPIFWDKVGSPVSFRSISSASVTNMARKTVGRYPYLGPARSFANAADESIAGHRNYSNNRSQTGTSSSFPVCDEF